MEQQLFDVPTHLKAKVNHFIADYFRGNRWAVSAFLDPQCQKPKVLWARALILREEIPNLDVDSLISFLPPSVEFQSAY